MKKRGAFSIIISLLKLVGSFIGVIFLAVVNGTIGFILSMGITVLASVVVIKYLGVNVNIEYNVLFICIVLSGFLRGILRYFEQYSNHYIAFKLLAILRDKIFAKLRVLAPSKLESKNKGELISILQSDIETLEVFYAHTISPFLIAVSTCTVVICFIGFTTSWLLALVALVGYVIIGGIIPVIYYKANKLYGKKYRKDLGEFEDFYLGSIYGGYEIISSNHQSDRFNDVKNKSNLLIDSNKKIDSKNILFRNITNVIIVILNIIIVVTGGILVKENIIDSPLIILAFVTFTSSFGSVVALANLPANLTMTFASGNRVLDLLEEEPMVEDAKNSEEFSFSCLEVNNVSFKYNNDLVLKDVSFKINTNEIVGILGPSGCGKSTILKLLMHYYDVNDGSILYNSVNVKDISFNHLYDNVNIFSQNTYLFTGTIYENLIIAKPNASMDEVIEACKNASIYEYISCLKDGFNTKITDLKDNLSSGEKQRLGLARVFLKRPKLLLLDEATSNIDAINEGIILNALKTYKKEMAIIMISHRKSTLSICDKEYILQDGVLIGS